MFGRKETPDEYRARKLRVQVEREQRHREYLIRQAAREQRQNDYLKRQAERERKFEFHNTVLQWKVKNRVLYYSEIGVLQTLPSRYTSSNAIQNYFQNFKPLIMAEARAIVTTNLAKCIQKKQPPIKLILEQCQHNKNPSIPSQLSLGGELQIEESYGRSAIVLLHPDTGTIFLANIRNNYTITAKCFIDDMDKWLFRENSVIQVYPLGSLITQMRMYEVCINMPYVSFEQQIINPGTTTGFLMNSMTQYMPKKNYLNSSQSRAIRNFMQTSNGLQLLQGPPGTGKTTTLAELIWQLCTVRGNILVTAPSNKAVCVLAKKFLNKNKSLNVPIILVGVKEKIDPDLQDIFLHDWLSNVIYNISNVLKKANKYIKEKKISQQKAIDLVKKLQHLSRTAKRFKHLLVFSQYLEFFKFIAKIDKPIDFFCEVGWLEYIREELRELKFDLSQQNDIAFEEELLKTAKVIFATLSVTGRHAMKVLQPIDVLIVDEAAQAVEAETLIPFMLEPRKCLLVGDTKQLPATVISQKAKKHHYDWSMMRRLIEKCRVPHGLLNIQYRMEPEIRRWPSRQYYRNQLRDSQKIVVGRHNPLLSISKQHPVLSKPYTFIDVIGKEKASGNSYINKAEAELCATIVKHFCQSKRVMPGEIGVISFYSEQVKLIKRLLARKKISGVPVHTVDGFQGDEKELIILSFVRANPKGYIGFIKDFRRLNVAITRAKFMLILLGNVGALGQKKSDVYVLIEDAKKRNRIFTADAILKEMIPKKTVTKVIKNSRSVTKPVKRKEEKTLNIKFYKKRRGKIFNGKKKSVNQKNRYKTILCKFFMEKSSCWKGNKCLYAHGKKELRI